jgi:hypothetical protein
MCWPDGHQLPVAARYALGERDVSETGPFLEHWTNIDSERLERYETMYQWSAAAEAFAEHTSRRNPLNAAITPPICRGAH